MLLGQCDVVDGRINIFSCHLKLAALLDNHKLQGREFETIDGDKQNACLIDWVRLNVPPTQYRSYGDGFLQVKWPNQQCQSTEGTNVCLPISVCVAGVTKHYVKGDFSD